MGVSVGAGVALGAGEPGPPEAAATLDAGEGLASGEPAGVAGPVAPAVAPVGANVPGAGLMVAPPHPAARIPATRTASHGRRRAMRPVA